METVPTSHASSSSTSKRSSELNTSSDEIGGSYSMIKSRDIYLNTPLHLLVGTKDTKEKKKVIEVQMAIISLM